MGPYSDLLYGGSSAGGEFGIGMGIIAIYFLYKAAKKDGIKGFFETLLSLIGGLILITVLLVAGIVVVVNIKTIAAVVILGGMFVVPLVLVIKRYFTEKIRGGK